MESRNKLTWCRLCLCKSESFCNIFEENDWQGYFAAVLIPDLLQFQISISDGYPHVVCSSCITKLLDFKRFKEICLKSMVTYDSIFISGTSLVKHHSEMATLKPEEVIIDSSSTKVYEYPVKENEAIVVKSEKMIVDSSHDEESEHLLEEAETEVSHRPILLKDKVLPFSRDSQPQEELNDSEAFENQSTVELTAPLMQDYSQAIIKSEEVIIDSSRDEESEHLLELAETEVTHRPILLKEEVIPFHRDSHRQEEFFDSEAFGNQSTVELTARLIQDSPQAIIKSEEVIIDSSHDEESEHLLELAETEAQLTAKDLVTKPHNLHCLQHTRPRWTPIGALGADLCTRNISTSDGLLSEETNNISLSDNVEVSSIGRMDGLDGQRRIPGETIGMDPLIQEDTGISVEVENKGKEEMDGEGEGRRGRASGKRAKAYRERLHCYHCGKVSRSKNGLIRHMKSHGFGRIYDCDVCGKVYKKKDRLDRHVMIHTGSKPYKCEKCSKCFITNGELKTHSRIHMASKLYKCVECSYCCNNSVDLNKHMRLHTGSKPYKCPECSKSFSDDSNFKKHMRLHTGSKPYKCAECSKSFSDSSNFKKHTRFHTRSKQ